MSRMLDDFEAAKVFGKAAFLLIFLIPAGIAVAALIVNYM
jgi:hypothetical protein